MVILSPALPLQTAKPEFSRHRCPFARAEISLPKPDELISHDPKALAQPRFVVSEDGSNMGPGRLLVQTLEMLGVLDEMLLATNKYTKFNYNIFSGKLSHSSKIPLADLKPVVEKHNNQILKINSALCKQPAIAVPVVNTDGSLNLDLLDKKLANIANLFREFNCKGDFKYKITGQDLEITAAYTLRNPWHLWELRSILNTNPRDLKLTDRQCGQDLIKLLAKYSEKYMQATGMHMDNKGFNEYVKLSSELRENAILGFRIDPQCSEKEFRQWLNSMNVVDFFFIARIFGSGICRRNDVRKAMLA